MFDFFATESASAIPVSPINAAALPAWLEAHPESRAWLGATGFSAAPGTFAFVPNADGRA